MKILITGCARSGTTMLTHMMRYFYSTNVIHQDEAHPYDYFDYNDKDHVLVIKKPYIESGQMGHFSPQNMMLMGFRIIWLLRDGMDVITSPNHHVPESRWVEANERLLPIATCGDLLIVGYERLVSRPDKVMDEIGQFIGQGYQDDYVDFWKLMNQSDPMNAGITPQPIHTSAVGRWHDIDKADLPKTGEKFRKLRKIFGYE